MRFRPVLIWDRGGPLLVCAAVLWAANAIAARLSVGQVSPMAMVAIRWLLICILLAAILPTAIRASAPLMWSRRWTILLTAAIGLTAFNALLYIAAHHTTAVNMVLLQCLIPVLVLLGSRLMGGRVLPTQYVGVAVTVLGVAVVATRGHLADILALRLNFGDLMVLATCVLGAAYNLMLANRLKVPAPVFFAGLSLGAFLSSIPFVSVEYAMGDFQWPTPIGWAIIVFMVFGPGLGAQVLFLRAVDLIGPGRAGAYNNLIPVFGAMLGVFLLGETFAYYHGAGLALVLAGIWLCERRKRV